MASEASTGSSKIEGDLFPFPSPRIGQDGFLKEARETLSSRRHLLAHAPTGLGKTAVALTASLEVGLSNDLLVFFLTSKQSQHRIAVETLRRISNIRGGLSSVDIISKQSLCPVSGSCGPSSFQDFCKLRIASESCHYYSKSTKPLVNVVRRKVLHVDELAYLCRIFGRCPHRTAMDCLPEADIVICDYNYIFSPFSGLILEKAERSLEESIIVVDEAHNLPSRIRDHLRGTIGSEDIIAATREAKSLDRRLPNILHKFGTEVQRLFTDETMEADKDLLLAPLRRALGGGNRRIDRCLDRIKSCGEIAASRGVGTSLLTLGDFLGSWIEETSPILRTICGKERKLSYVFLDPSITSHETFDKAHSSILMSGTLFPAEIYTDLLGIPKARCVVRTFSSPFPRENRRVVSATYATTLYKRRGDVTYQAYANLIISMSSVLHGNLAVFFPSYEFLECVRARMRLSDCNKDIILEKQGSSNKEKAAVLQRLNEGREKGLVLLAVLGASLSEGVDFRDNLLRAVLICGIPLTPPTIENEALRMYYSSRFGKSRGYDYSYLIPAMNKIVQAAGRCIRSETDRAIIVLADSRFAQGRYRRFLPRELLGTEEDVKQAIVEFFATA